MLIAVLLLGEPDAVDCARINVMPDQKIQGNRRVWALWLWALWVACLLVASLQPVRLGIARAGTVSHLILHVFAFGIPALLMSLPDTRRIWIWAAIASTLSLAAGIEVVQRLLYRHAFEWPDLAADVAGIAMAIVLRVLHGHIGIRHSA